MRCESGAESLVSAKRTFIGVNRRVVGELERGKGTVQLQIAMDVARVLGLDIELKPRGR